VASLDVDEAAGTKLPLYLGDVPQMATTARDP
jgi:hypothetical protein